RIGKRFILRPVVGVTWWHGFREKRNCERRPHAFAYLVRLFGGDRQEPLAVGAEDRAADLRESVPVGKFGAKAIARGFANVQQIARRGVPDSRPGLEIVDGKRCEKLAVGAERHAAEVDYRLGERARLVSRRV